MKFCASVAILLTGLYASASNPYSFYLRHQLLQKPVAPYNSFQKKQAPVATIAPYQIPKGAIFCRMEDKLTKATKIWIKVGVQ